ncbi:hypothetical protein [Halorubrum vacuolatum]|uniref:Uncharacterized protein n=1 Tax=Halorubrum vacuolatum TaxID=63740 RepID=A0A238XAH1_HALVU|nr:hypothetical protein [Halorubrum vacuolatum]SNR56035.1 hypothetical protein SAMN06264855_11557 [Halorubrum vacuolatum]
MKNPWVHDEVPEGRSIHESRAKLIGTVLWGMLLLTVGAFVLFPGVDTANIAGADGLSTAVTIVLATLALVLTLPLVLKLLAVSRLLAALALLGSWWIVGRFVIARERDWLAGVESVAAVREAVDDALGPLAELPEIIEELPEATEEPPEAVVLLSEEITSLLGTGMTLLPPL